MLHHHDTPATLPALGSARPTGRLQRLRARAGRGAPTRRHGSAAGGDAGVSSVEAAILAPVLLTLLFGIIQTGLFFHARDVASSAAQVAAQRARVVDGTGGAGQAAASQYVHDTAGAVLLSPSVSVSRTTTSVHVVVTGDTPSLVPGLPMPSVSATADAPVERLTR